MSALLFLLALGLPQDTTTVTSPNGMVVSASAVASRVGADVLKRGGNAVDAAVATAFALAVTYPSAGNIGGGGFMIIQPPAGKAVAIDYRERAPGRSTPTMYLGADGQIDRSLTAAGWLAPGVPGTVRGMELAHRAHGRLAWRDVVLPAAELAERGFPLAEDVARGLNWALRGPMAPFPASVTAYGKSGGGEWSEGDTLRLPELARSLRAIADDGPDAFYTGWIADRIADGMAANGGIITREDLAGYRARVREPVRGSYRGFEIVSMPPPSSGGIVLVQALNILERFDLPARPRYDPTTIHLIVEAQRRAFLDRARHLGDPDFVAVPVARLTSKDYAAELARGIDTTRATSSVVLGADIVTQPVGAEPEETTHFSIVDADGMAVSNTYTLEGGFGSFVVVPGTGFLLNNEMGDFNKKPGETNASGDIGTPANLIAPGKRMLSSMTPAMVRRDGRTVLITGSPGGRTIPNTVLNIVLNVTAFGMPVRAAVDGQRIHHQWLPDQAFIEAGALDSAGVATFKARGHDLRVVPRWGIGDGHSITVDPKTGVASGANDRRSPGSGVAVP
ncbi:MAG TPA: gamma-glutamyltransferase [Gemmatimonadales bacterium]